MLATRDELKPGCLQVHVLGFVPCDGSAALPASIADGRESPSSMHAEVSTKASWMPREALVSLSEGVNAKFGDLLTLQKSNFNSFLPVQLSALH